MIKWSWIFILLTLINIGLFFLGHFKQGKNTDHFKESSYKKSTDLARVKDDLFFKSLLDESRILFSKRAPFIQPTLILRFSFRNCDLCRISSFFELERFKKEVSIKNFRVVGSFLNQRDFEAFKQIESGFSFEIEDVPENYFGLQLEQEAIYPFFFLLFPDGTARHVFIPIKEDVARTRQYLEIIRQKYFNNENAPQ